MIISIFLLEFVIVLLMNSNIYERKNSNEVIVLWKICLNFIESE